LHRPSDSNVVLCSSAAGADYEGDPADVIVLRQASGTQISWHYVRVPGALPKAQTRFVAHY